MQDGFEAPFIRVFFNNREITDSFESMRYVYDEEDDDEIEIQLKSDSRGVADKPEFQEKAQLLLIWGFIKGVTSHVRKVTIRDAVWQYTRENVVGVLKCTEKGSELKGATTKEVHKKKSLIDLVQDKGKKHDLLTELILPKDKLPTTSIAPLPGETSEQFFKRDKNKATYTVTSGKNPGLLYQGAPIKMVTLKDLQAVKDREDAAKAAKANGPIDLSKLTDLFQKHDSLPQAGKSDKQILDETAQRDVNGPYIVETRDDKIMIKKRDFGKVPYKAYEYGGPLGDLLEFIPETKTRGRMGTSTSMGFGNWNGLDKTFTSGTADGADGSPVLAHYIEMRNFYQDVSKKGGGALITTTNVKTRAYTASPNTLKAGMITNNVARADNTLVRTNSAILVPVTIDDRVAILDKQISDYKNPDKNNETANKDFYNPKGNGKPADAYAQANNHRKNSELNKNCASAIVWGDPKIETGQIITIIGASKKHSGNYYIKKSTHTVTKEGYFTELELVRQGHNIASTKNHKNHKELGRDLNQKFGTITKELHRTKSLKIKTN